MSSPKLRLAVLLFLIALVALMWAAAFASKRQERAAAGVAPLPQRMFETLTVVAAGSGGAFENHWRRGPVLAVGYGADVVLVDAGRGASAALRAAEIPAHQPRLVLLSNLLPESLLGLDALWLDGYLRAPEAPLQIAGPPGGAALVRGLASAWAAPRAALADAWQLAPAGGALEARDLQSGASFMHGGLHISTAVIGAGPHAPPALAYRFSAGGRAITVAAAGSDAAAIAAFARGSQLLVTGGIYGASLLMAREAALPSAEIARLEREAKSRLRLEQIGGVATDAGVAGVMLVRLRPPPVFAFQYERLVRETFRGGPVLVAEDGETLAP